MLTLDARQTIVAIRFQLRFMKVLLGFLIPRIDDDTAYDVKSQTPIALLPVVTDTVRQIRLKWFFKAQL